MFHEEVILVFRQDPGSTWDAVYEENHHKPSAHFLDGVTLAP